MPTVLETSIGTEPPRCDDLNPLMRHLPRRFLAPIPPRMEELEALLAEMLLAENSASTDAATAARAGNLEQFSAVQTRAAALPMMRRAVVAELLELRVEHAKANAALVCDHERAMRQVVEERQAAARDAVSAFAEAKSAKARLGAHRSLLADRVKEAEAALASFHHPRLLTATDLIEQAVARQHATPTPPSPSSPPVPMDKYQKTLRDQYGPNAGLKNRPTRKAQ